jgi:hypothetical protein
MLLSDHLPFPDFFPWWWLHAVVFDEHIMLFENEYMCDAI